MPVFRDIPKDRLQDLGALQADGLEGLTDRSRRPYRQANKLPFQIESLIVSVKKEQPSWGAPKIREKLGRLYPDIKAPAVSTVHAVLDRHGLVQRRKRRRFYDLGYFDEDTCRLEPIEDPFGRNVLPMSRE